MAIAHEFEYYKPKTVPEAVDLLGKSGGRVRVLAGGTDLIGWIREEMIAPEAVIDIKGLSRLRRIERSGGVIRIGSLTTWNALIDSPLIRRQLPLLWEAAGMVASTGLRNRATLVGNICSAVPCCDGGPSLLAYDASVVVLSRSGYRRIPIGEWFVANKVCALRPDELVIRLEVPVPKKHGACYVKLGRYKGEDLAQASVAVVALAGGKYRVALGAVGPRPVRAGKIEAALKGKGLKAVDKAKRLVPREIMPISDVRATKEYRTHMVKVMLERGLEAAVKRRSGKGPAYGERMI